MKTSENGQTMIKMLEESGKPKLTAYKCPSGKWTIGYGHTKYVKFYKKNVYSGMTITKEQAEELFDDDIVKYENAVMKYDNIYHWTQNEFDALVSFSLNIGSIDELTKNGTRTKQKIASMMPEYRNKGTAFEDGLLKRRNQEKALFLKGTASQDTSATAKNPYTAPQSVLRKGSVGNEVKWLQWELKQAKYDIAIDGDFGKKTDEAVRKFQKLYNLTVDGIVGAKTVSMLRAK